MNYRMMIYMLGWVLNFEAVFMLPSLAVACFTGKRRAPPFCLPSCCAHFWAGWRYAANRPGRNFMPGKDLSP